MFDYHAFVTFGASTLGGTSDSAASERVKNSQNRSDLARHRSRGVAGAVFEGGSAKPALILAANALETTTLRVSGKEDE
ncbi:hypothetical protein GCM10011329_06270 [Stakelama pacifica]|nr:hypothetical protein GCM10011329_06270 [Stakelama pacifica]